MAKTADYRNLVSAGLVILFALGIIYVSRQLPEGHSDTPGAGVYPAFIAVCLALLGVVQILQTFVLELGERDGPEISKDAVKRLTVPFLVLFLYILLLPVLGFFLGSVLFLILLMRYSHITEYHVSIPLSIGVAGVLQFIFGRLLRVPLPEGIVGIHQVLRLLGVA